MKKTIALLLLSVCLLVAGCGNDTVDPNSVVAPNDITVAPATETTAALVIVPDEEIDEEELYEEEYLYEEEEYIEEDYYEDDDEEEEEEIPEE